MLSRAQSSRCSGLALFHGLVLHIGLTSLHLYPLGQICPRKISMSMSMSFKQLYLVMILPSLIWLLLGVMESIVV